MNINNDINFMNKNMIGRFELIIGPMFASKSTTLIQKANMYKSIGKNILPINHKFNNRYDTNNISTHDKNILDDCIILDNLNDIILNYNDLYIAADVILIEELQFFNDALSFITNAVDIDNKIVIAVGLSGSFNREPMGEIANLIPHCDHLTKLHAFCNKCNDGTIAHFTILQEDSTNQDNNVIIGSKDKYIPVCRYHYNKEKRGAL